MDKKGFIVSSSPHIHDKDNVNKIMYMVIIALLPALFSAVYFFGFRALWHTIISVAAAVLTEYVFNLIWKHKQTIKDGSAVITGMLLAFNIPANSPLWMGAVGSFVAILIAKMVFGGLGYNFINPALAGRAFLMASWPSFMTHFIPMGNVKNLSGTTIDAISTATPLNVVKLYGDQYADALNSMSTIKALIVGNVGGVIGETSAIALLIGAIFLMILKIIDWRIPLSYIGTVFVLSGIFYWAGISPVTPIFHIFAGGLILGAFFMATDMATSPVTPLGRWIFGIGCGILTIVIRQWGGYPEGVSYSILLMNVATPLIDRLTMPKVFGGGK